MVKQTSSTDIEAAAATAIKVIADASLQATKLLATQASEAAKITDTKNGNDHDTIVEIKTMQQVMLGEIREIKTGTAQAMADHETRINKLETSNTRLNVMLSIGVSIVSLLVSVLVWHVVGK